MSRVLVQRVVLGLSVLGASACRIVTVQTDPLPATPNIVVTQGTAVRAWKLVSNGRDAGSLVRFEESLGSERFLFSVRNAHGQDLGLVDEQGRAWRFRPFDEAEWITTGTVADGARAILELGSEARLVEVPLGDLRDAAEASAGR